MRICIVGDTGSGNKEQYKVAEHIQLVHKNKPLEAVLILGDNIYEHGVDSIDDEQFMTKFEEPYKSIDLPFYLLLGNHDYANISGTDAFTEHAIHQINYHNRSDKWNMPKRYYSVALGNCEFFMLDTNLENMTKNEIDKQIKYFRNKIKKSKKSHKYLCGHHTWRSTGGHGNADPQFEKFMRKIVYGTNIRGYFCGHDHCKNHITIPFPVRPRKRTSRNYRTTKRNKKKLHIYVIGTGGKSMDMSYLDENNIVKPDELKHQDADLGFIILDSHSNKVNIHFINSTTKLPSLKYSHNL